MTTDADERLAIRHVRISESLHGLGRKQRVMEPVDIVKEAYAAILDRGDLEGFLSFFAEDGALLEADSLPYGGRFVGADAIREALLKVVETFSTFSFKPDVFATSGEWVIAYGTFAVTVRSTGIQVSFPLAEATHVVGGKIKLINPVYGDTAAILAALK